MLTPNSPGVKDNLEKIKSKLRDKNIKVYFLPSQILIKILINGKHPLIQGMPESFLSILISGKGLLIQKRLLFSYLSGDLDKKNEFILNNGEIRLLGTDQSIINTIQ